MQRVHGVVQHYAWGDPVFIPSLLGVEPDGEPWAELWIGTHPSGPATLDDGRPLRDLTGELPYLLKVLAAAEPLSLQTHPDADQARDGFERGVYPDPNPKPELLCALTEFDALCGIRPVDATIGAARRARPADPAARPTCCHPTDRGGVLDALYRATIDAQPVVDACATSDRAEARLGPASRRALPRRPERGRHIAVQPRPCSNPARRSGSMPATSTPTSRARRSS